MEPGGRRAPGDPVQAATEALRKHSAVLVRRGEALVGILTKFDVLEQLAG